MGGFFCSLTPSDYIPQIPLPLPDLDSAYPPLEACQKPRWVDPRYYSLAYTPVSPRYDPPFDVLKLPKTIPVTQIQTNKGEVLYATPHAQLQALEKLERELLEISRILSVGAKWVPLYFRDVPVPQSFGYRHQHKQPRHATRAIKDSRDAFVGLMALDILPHY